MIKIVMFSGGKDSSALVHYMIKKGETFQTVFCNTGWELPETIKFIHNFNETYLDGKLIELRNEKYDSVPDLIRKKGHVPSVHARFCTEELKIKPLREFLKTLVGETHMYNGIRAAESKKRAMMEKDVWDDGLNAWVHRPLLDWSDQKVFQFLQENEIIINPLYKMGCRRVGCGPCILASLKELAAMKEIHPERFEEIHVMETDTGRTYFSEKMIPERFRTGKSSKGAPLTTVHDLLWYLDNKRKYVEISEDVGESCFSYYNLCE